MRRFAVMLNYNAKKVSAEVRAELARLVPPDDLFFSSSLEEAQRITQLLVERRYPVVFTGGGDGTVIDFIERITRVAEDMPQFPCPNIGILRLGTGNALAQMVSSGSFASDIKAYVENGFQDLQRLGLVEFEGRRFPFCGFGWDAEILNDYIAVKERFKDTPFLGKFSQSLGGYGVAIGTRTIPRIFARTVRRQTGVVTIRNLGERAYRLGVGGNVRRVIRQGETIYEGPLSAVIVGTSPYYGFGLKVLPFAGLTPHFMQVRVASIPLRAALANIGPLWNGEWYHDEMRDYYATDLLIELDQDFPFQIGGDGQGWRRGGRFTLSEASVQLVRFI